MTARSRLATWLVLMGVCLGVAVIAAAKLMAEDVPLRIVDGDTLAQGAERIRLVNIDAPEIFHPQCASELQWGWLARNEMARLIGNGSAARIVSAGRRDRYGRLLANVLVNGIDVGDTLVSENLAVVWGNGKPNWCAMKGPTQ